MTAQTITCVVLLCDGCGAKQDIDGMRPHYDTAEQARNFERHEDGWWSDGTLDLCDSCVYDPHPSDTDEYGWCRRCGDEASDEDRHDSEFPVVPTKQSAEGATR